MSPAGPDHRAPSLRNSLAAALVAWAASRAALAALMAASFLLRGQRPPMLGMWVEWDASYYLQIAAHGYAAPVLVTGDETGESTLNFFPLLPIGIRLLALSLDRPVAPWIGLVLTNLCLVAAGAMLHRLAATRLGRPAANPALASLMLLPGSFVASGVMTEAPFLALSIGAALLADRARTGAASACLSLLAIDRLTGIFQAFGLGLDWIRARLAGAPAEWGRLPALFLVPVPLVLYFLDMYRVSGDAFAVLHSHTAFWHQQGGAPFQDLVAFLWSDQARLRLQAVVALPMLAVLVWAWRSFSLGEWLFLAASIEVTTSGVTLAPSLLRYLIGLYPLHLAFGRLAARATAGGWLLAAMAVVDAALAIPWAHGSDLLQ